MQRQLEASLSADFTSITKILRLFGVPAKKICRKFLGTKRLDGSGGEGNGIN